MRNGKFYNIANFLSNMPLSLSWWSSGLENRQPVKRYAGSNPVNGAYASVV